MQDLRYRVSRLRFCPAMRDAANQIQIECCTGAALDNTNGPKLKQPGIAGGGAATGKRRLSLTAPGRAIPEPERRWRKDAGAGERGRNRARRRTGKAGRGDRDCRCLKTRHRGRPAGEQNLGGEAFRSFGGLFPVDGPETALVRHRGRLRPHVAGPDRQRRLRTRPPATQSSSGQARLDCVVASAPHSDGESGSITSRGAGCAALLVFLETEYPEPALPAEG